MSELLPLLLVRPADVAPLAFVCGDPARARRIAERFDEARQVGSNREYETFTGTVQGHPVTVSSHGGFSSVIEHNGKMILFDAGTDARVFESNLKSLKMT